MEKYSNIAQIGSIRGIPAIFFIDRKGFICQRFLGLTEEGALEEALQPLLLRGYDLDHFFERSE